MLRYAECRVQGYGEALRGIGYILYYHVKKGVFKRIKQQNIVCAIFIVPFSLLYTKNQVISMVLALHVISFYKKVRIVREHFCDKKILDAFLCKS